MSLLDGKLISSGEFANRSIVNPPRAKNDTEKLHLDKRKLSFTLDESTKSRNQFPRITTSRVHAAMIPKLSSSYFKMSTKH